MSNLASVRVRFLRFGPSSLDVEVFAYVLAQDWSQFLEIQEELQLQHDGVYRVDWSSDCASGADHTAQNSGSADPAH